MKWIPIPPLWYDYILNCYLADLLYCVFFILCVYAPLQVYTNQCPSHASHSKHNSGSLQMMELIVSFWRIMLRHQFKLYLRIRCDHRRSVINIQCFVFWWITESNLLDLCFDLNVIVFIKIYCVVNTLILILSIHISNEEPQLFNNHCIQTSTRQYEWRPNGRNWLYD